MGQKEPVGTEKSESAASSNLSTFNSVCPKTGGFAAMPCHLAPSSHVFSFLAFDWDV